MNDLDFFPPARRLSLAVVAREGDARIPQGADPARLFESVAALDAARQTDVSFSGSDRSLQDLRETRAGACFVPPHQAGHVPSGTIALVTTQPLRAFRRVASLFHPDSTRPTPLLGRAVIDPGAIVHPDARLEPAVRIDPGVVIGARVEIGSGTTIGANSTIGAGVRIGRDCAIAAHVSIIHALVGDRVVLEAGARIGHGAFDLEVTGSRVPHLGRVILQDEAEIGANAVIARGSVGDTIVGEGARIDALVFVASDTTIARNATITRQDQGTRSRR